MNAPNTAIGIERGDYAPHYLCENPKCNRVMHYPPVKGLCDTCELEAQERAFTTVSTKRPEL